LHTSALNSQCFITGYTWRYSLLFYQLLSLMLTLFTITMLFLFYFSGLDDTDIFHKHITSDVVT
jgi:hypothetical protein